MFRYKKSLLSMALALMMAMQAAAVVYAKDVKSDEMVDFKAPKLALKVDRYDKDQLPRNFRMGNDIFKGLTKDGVLPSRKGMDQLNVSASSTCSEKEFENVLLAVPVNANKVYDIDLRAESHGYLDGMSVSWFAASDWGNDGRTQDIILNLEKDQLRNAFKQQPIEVYTFDDNINKVGPPIEVHAGKVRTEEQMVRSHGANYFRLALQDHFRPDDPDVDRFLEFYKKLPADAWLHYHGYAGMGRTTIFMVMHDILKNAQQVSFQDIIKRQALIGIVDLSEIPDSKKNWERKAYIERYQFVKQFYSYVKSNPELKKSYSQWTKEHGYESYTPDYTGYIWRIDATNKNALPRNFRTCQSAYQPIDKKYIKFFQENYIPSRAGLDTLNISGSAQCSVDEFKALVKELRTVAKGPIYDVDLRQESHGFFNNDAVSFYGLRDWGNVDKKSSNAIRKDENARIKNALNKEVIVSELAKNKLAQEPKSIRVQQAMTEEELAQSEGVNYYRITATDHVWPAAQYVDQFIGFYKNLPADAWLHFHCEAGVGRTTVYMVMVDMMKNPSLSFEDILQREHMIGGNYVAYTVKNPKKDDWKADYYNDKARMVKWFYKYVKANHADNYKTSWSEWIAANDVLK